MNLAEQQQDKTAQGRILGNIVALHYARGKIDDAIVYMKRGIALSEEMNNRGIQAIQLGNLGGIYYSLGDF